MSHLNSSNWVKKVSNKTVITIIAGLAIILLAALPDVRAIIFANWFYLVILLCPLMHIFLHGKHGSHKGGENEAGRHGPVTSQSEKIEQKNMESSDEHRFDS